MVRRRYLGYVDKVPLTIGLDSTHTSSHESRLVSGQVPMKSKAPDQVLNGLRLGTRTSIHGQEVGMWTRTHGKERDTLTGSPGQATDVVDKFPWTEDRVPRHFPWPEDMVRYLDKISCT